MSSRKEPVSPTAEQEFGKDTGRGSTVRWARENHTHGTPDDPIEDVLSKILGSDYKVRVDRNEDGTITITLPGSIQLDGSTALRLLATDANKRTVSADLASWIAGTANQITVTDDSDGSVTLLFASPTRLGSAAQIASGNYTEAEADGTLVFTGDATVWKDIKFPMAPPKTTGAGNPTLVTWNGNLRGYSFAVNDVHDFNGEEIDHDAKVGSTATWHIHFISRDNETERTVKYQLEYAIEPASGAIPAPTTISAEFIIAAGTAANTPQRGNLGTFAIPGIAKLAYARLTRIASSGTEPTTDPVVGAIHFHYEIDTVGSREIITK